MAEMSSADSEIMKTLGVKLFPLILLEVAHMELMQTRINEEAPQKCHNLGSAVAEELI